MIWSAENKKILAECRTQADMLAAFPSHALQTLKNRRSKFRKELGLSPLRAPSLEDSGAVERYVIIPDVQCPFEDKHLWANFIDFLRDYQPDKLFQVGDFTDSHSLSRWVRGLPGEYTPNALQDSFDRAYEMLAEIRSVYSGPFEMVRSNHDDRLALYLEQKAPALIGLRDLTIEKQLHLDELKITFQNGMVDIAPGWAMFHGDEGNLSNIPGQTAMKLAKKTGLSVVCGHTHRAGLTAETAGYFGKTRVLHGLEVGNFCEMEKMDYLKTGAANWQQGFGILYVVGTSVTPHLVPVDGKKRFIVEGKKYGF